MRYQTAQLKEIYQVNMEGKGNDAVAIKKGHIIRKNKEDNSAQDNTSARTCLSSKSLKGLAMAAMNP